MAGRIEELCKSAATAQAGSFVLAAESVGPAAPRVGGIACIVLAVLCFGALDTTTKFASATAPMLMALWFRYVVQTAVTGAVLGPRRGVRLPLLLVATNTGFLTSDR